MCWPVLRYWVRTPLNLRICRACSSAFEFSRFPRPCSLHSQRTPDGPPALARPNAPPRGNACQASHPPVPCTVRAMYRTSARLPSLYFALAAVCAHGHTQFKRAAAGNARDKGGAGGKTREMPEPGRSGLVGGRTCPQGAHRRVALGGKALLGGLGCLGRHLGQLRALLSDSKRSTGSVDVGTSTPCAATIATSPPAKNSGSDRWSAHAEREGREGTGGSARDRRPRMRRGQRARPHFWVSGGFALYGASPAGRSAKRGAVRNLGQEIDPCGSDFEES